MTFSSLALGFVILALMVLLAVFLDMRLFDRALHTASRRHMAAFLAERGPHPPDNTPRTRLIYDTEKVEAHIRDIEWYNNRECEILIRPFGTLYLTLRAKLTRHPWPEQPFPEHRDFP